MCANSLIASCVVSSDNIDAKRQTEVELFASTVIGLGKKYQIATPINNMLYQSIKQLEQI